MKIPFAEQPDAATLGSTSRKKRWIAQATALLIALSLCFFALVPMAHAGTTEGNVAYNNIANNMNDQTIVGEGDDNYAIVTNDAQGAPSPTAFLMENSAIVAVAIVALCALALVLLRARKNSAEVNEDEE